MKNKFWVAFIVAFIVLAILEFIVNNLLMASCYEQTSQLWRPMGEMKMWIFYVVYLFIAFFFTLIFSRWQRGRGLMDGLQFGVYAGMMVAVPMAYASYASMPIPYSFALQWFIYGLLEYIILGTVVAAVYGKKLAEVAPA
jgi:hypothetical protein